MSRAEAKPAALYHRAVVYVLFLILLLPLAGTLLYSLSTSWSATILPDGLTFKWYLQLWSDERFLRAFGQSLLVCFGALALSICAVIAVPAGGARSAILREACLYDKLSAAIAGTAAAGAELAARAPCPAVRATRRGRSSAAPARSSSPRPRAARPCGRSS